MTPEERVCFEELLALSPIGPRIEFGVFHGRTLKMIAAHDGVTVGVDSFEGMDEPTARDLPAGKNPYPQGRLAAPLADAISAVGPDVHLVKGFVPAVLGELPEGPYAFAHVDMDHYRPTLAALHWLWPRMKSGGLVCVDDWFPDSDCLAAGALKEFAAEHPMTGSQGRKAWWIC